MACLMVIIWKKIGKSRGGPTETEGTAVSNDSLGANVLPINTSTTRYSSGRVAIIKPQHFKNGTLPIWNPLKFSNDTSLWKYLQKLFYFWLNLKESNYVSISDVYISKMFIGLIFSISFLLESHKAGKNY